MSRHVASPSVFVEMTISRERLQDLLVDPREDLDFEIKNWLDLRDSNGDKATFAKAILALANHGGGFIGLGLVETDTGIIEADGRPATFDNFGQDLINGIVQNYCDPPFHCAVHIVSNPAGSLFPIVVVPGGHRVPIRARRAGPNGNTVQSNGIYVRKPGPRSEAPQSAQDWEGLLNRCLRNRRDEMLDQIRDLISGAVPQIDRPPEATRLQGWIRSCRQRWEELIRPLPPNVGPRMPHGRYRVAYEISGERRPIAAAQFREELSESTVRYTGWPPFWYPTRAGIEPYLIDGSVECWLGGDSQTPPERRDAAHSDFWRIHLDGLAFLLRGYQEDGPQARLPGGREIQPGTAFDIGLPVWRIGEAMLHARSLSNRVFEGPTTIRFSVAYEGLAGRSLMSFDNRRDVWDESIARQDTIELETNIDAHRIDTNLPEIVQPLLAPLYALFNFSDLPMHLVTDELDRMRSRK